MGNTCCSHNLFKFFVVVLDISKKNSNFAVAKLKEPSWIPIILGNR